MSHDGENHGPPIHIHARILDDNGIPKLVFEPEPVPCIERNQEFVIEWNPGDEEWRQRFGIDAIELRAFKALVGPPWQEVECECGVQLVGEGVEDGSIRLEAPEPEGPELEGPETRRVQLATCWPSSYGHRLITFTVTVYRHGEPVVSFVDPWDEKPCP